MVTFHMVIKDCTTEVEIEELRALRLHNVTRIQSLWAYKCSEVEEWLVPSYLTKPTSIR
jgi:hypothetical protein